MTRAAVPSSRSHRVVSSGDGGLPLSGRFNSAPPPGHRPVIVRQRSTIRLIVDPNEGGLTVQGIRCGCCIANDHAHCVVNLEMGKGPGLYVWHCECPCDRGKTRCIACLRRGVTTVGGRCVDTASCEAARLVSLTASTTV